MACRWHRVARAAWSVRPAPADRRALRIAAVDPAERAIAGRRRRPQGRAPHGRGRRARRGHAASCTPRSSLPTPGACPRSPIRSGRSCRDRLAHGRCRRERQQAVGDREHAQLAAARDRVKQPVNVLEHPRVAPGTGRCRRRTPPAGAPEGRGRSPPSPLRSVSASRSRRSRRAAARRRRAAAPRATTAASSSSANGSHVASGRSRRSNEAWIAMRLPTAPAGGSSARTITRLAPATISAGPG